MLNNKNIGIRKFVGCNNMNVWKLKKQVNGNLNERGALNCKEAIEN